MELKNKMTMLISSCNAFSDLWDLHVGFLERNWPDRKMRKILITDKETDRRFPQVEVYSAGAELEWSERLGAAVSRVETEYVFLTLDDYFLTTPVDNAQIHAIVEMMDQQHLDYVRLSGFIKYPWRNRVRGYRKTWHLDTNRCYSVNLTAGIWRKSFLEHTAQQALSAWKYEVSLARIAREQQAKCVLCKDHDFRVLDVVRKGKLLNRANRYFKKHNLYHGSREVISPWYEVKIFIRTWANRLLPQGLTDWARKQMIKRGRHYFSQEA